MHPELVAALAPVLRDLATSCSVTLEVRDEPWLEGPVLSAMVWEPAGSGTGIYIDQGLPAVEQIVWVADQVQEVAIEALWFAGRQVSWPPCPTHPNSHPLDAALVSSRAVWRCRASGDVISEIGAFEA